MTKKKIFLFSLAFILGGVLTARAVDMVDFQIWGWGGVQRLWLGVAESPRLVVYGLIPGQATAIQINPHPVLSTVPGPRSEITLHRTPGQSAIEPMEFFNLMTLAGGQYDAFRQDDHQIRFSMETLNGGQKLPMLFCWETTPGQTAYCPLRIYPKESFHRGVWICREEGDCFKLGG